MGRRIKRRRGATGDQQAAVVSPEEQAAGPARPAMMVPTIASAVERVQREPAFTAQPGSCPPAL